jgi:dihydrofolate reductase
MRKLIADEWMTLDGVIQAPGYDGEDRDGGFEHGGWHSSYMDETAMEAVVEGVTSAGGFLLGRRTYEIFAGYWPTAPAEEEALAQPLTTKPKYVVSRTLTEPLDWQNSTLVQGDVVEAVAGMKQTEGADLHVIGSSRLFQTLTEHGLVDEYRVMIDPVVVGGGKRLFHDDGVLRSLRLVDSQVTSAGVILATYATATDDAET